MGISVKHGPNNNRNGHLSKNTVQMDQHERNVQHGPNSNRVVTIKQRRVPNISIEALTIPNQFSGENILSFKPIIIGEKFL